VIDTGAAIRPIAFFVNGLDFFEQFLVGHLPLAGWPFSPNIIAARRYVQHPTHERYHKFLSVILDKLVSHRFGLLKMATVFFRMSLSCRRIAFSFSKCRILSCSGINLPFPGKAFCPFLFCFRFYLDSKPGVIPSSFSIADALLPLLCHN
jgi:hypothetical protein